VDKEFSHLLRTALFVEIVVRSIKMETTMYDDVSLLEPSSKKRKMNMTLDLQQTVKTKQVR
jgi:hypothetical protein